MIIESPVVAGKIKYLIENKQLKHVKKLADILTASRRYKEGFEFAVKLFAIERNMVFAAVDNLYFGFIADNEDEVLKRLGRIKLRIIPPQKVLAKSLAIRVKRINDTVARQNEDNADYRNKYPNAKHVVVDITGVKLGHSVTEFYQNLTEFISLNKHYFSLEIRDIKRLIEIDKINDDGLQQAYCLLITNEVLTE